MVNGVYLYSGLFPSSKAHSAFQQQSYSPTDGGNLPPEARWGERNDGDRVKEVMMTVTTRPPHRLPDRYLHARNASVSDKAFYDTYRSGCLLRSEH